MEYFAPTWNENSTQLQIIIARRHLLAYLLARFAEIHKTMKTMIHFAGLGNAGAIIAQYFLSRGLEGTYSCINNSVPLIDTTQINVVSCASPATKSEARRPEHRASEQISLLNPSVKHVFSEDHLYILLSGLGRYTGTMLSLQLTEYLLKHNKRFHLFCSMPYPFEGKITNEFAAWALKQLREMTSPVVIPLSRIPEKYGNITLDMAFEKVKDEFLWEFMGKKIV